MRNGLIQACYFLAVASYTCVNYAADLDDSRSALQRAAFQLAEHRVAEGFRVIKQDYMDPVDEAKLVMGCRRGIQLELTGHPDRYDTVHFESLEQKYALDQNESLTQRSALDQIANAFAAVTARGMQARDDKKIVDACLRGMVAALDGPMQSLFLDEAEFRELQTGGAQNAPLGGLGLELRIENGVIKVVSALVGGVAQRANLQSGDIIARIDNTPTKGLSLSDVISRLRGERGSKVFLTVIRESTQQSMEFTLIREIFRIKAIQWRTVAPGYAYIRIAQFSSSTSEELASAIVSVYEENKTDLKGLILDLRNNPGGLLNVSVAVSAAFLQENLLVSQTKGRAPDSIMRLIANARYYVRSREPNYLGSLPSGLKTVPLVVLVNHATASGSEIVAAALQDHRRAVVVGARTLGLGVIQTVIPLGGNTAFKLNTARFYRPGGASIASFGVTPDFVIDGGQNELPPFDESDDAYVGKGLNLLRSAAF